MADRYFYAQGSSEHGPYSAPQLRELATAGRLQPSDLVWKEGTSQRVPASRIKNLFAAAPEPAPVPPAVAAEDDDAGLYRLLDIDTVFRPDAEEAKKVSLTEAEELAANPDFDVALYRLKPVDDDDAKPVPAPVKPAATKPPPKR